MHLPIQRLLPLGIAAAILVLVVPTEVSARTLYVDNLLGSNAYDGLTARPFGEFSGPFKTITKALEVAMHGDVIQIANNNKPYYESLQLSGERHSGEETAPFTIQGNGAIISGLRLVPAHAWEEVEPQLWRFKPLRKGFYSLLLSGQPVDRHMTPNDHGPSRAAGFPQDLPAGSWTDWQGAIYYQAIQGYDPRRAEFAFAADSVGISLFQVRNVLIQDLTLQHFRLDGVNAHDLVNLAVLNNVTTVGNARSGIAVGGTSYVEIYNSTVKDNLTWQILLMGLGTVRVEESELSEEPTYVE